MLLGSRSTGSKKRWPRGQRFTLSAAGAAADDAHRAAVAAARASGRSALDAALAAWAAPLGVSPGDGVLLAEVRGARRSLPELIEALEAAGVEANEVRAAVDRLVGAGLVEAIPLASQQPAV